MRVRWARREVTQLELAIESGVSINTIRNALSGATWRDVRQVTSDEEKEYRLAESQRRLKELLDDPSLVKEDVASAIPKELSDEEEDSVVQSWDPKEYEEAIRKLYGTVMERKPAIDAALAAQAEEKARKTQEAQQKLEEAQKALAPQPWTPKPLPAPKPFPTPQGLLLIPCKCGQHRLRKGAILTDRETGIIHRSDECSDLNQR